MSQVKALDTTVPRAEDWDAVAERITGDITGARYEFVWQMLEDPQSPMLDIGCGQGRLLSRARAAGLATTGMDISAAGLARARVGFAAGSPLVAGSGVDLPFRSERFATVTMTEVIEHIPDPFAALQEVHRVMLPGGQLAITTPTSLQQVVERIGLYRSFQPFDRALALTELVEMLGRAGFVKPRIRMVPISMYTFAVAYYRGRLRPDAPVRWPMPAPVSAAAKSVDLIASPVLKGLMKILPRAAGQYFARMALISVRKA